MPSGGAGQLLSEATYLAEPRPRTSRFAPAPARDAIPAGFQQKNNHRKVVTRLGWSETACGEQNHLGLSCVQKLFLTSAAPYNMVNLAGPQLGAPLPSQINELS